MSESWAFFIISLALTIIGALIARVLLQIDKNQKGLAAEIKSWSLKHEELAKDFYQMRGEHYSNHGGRRVTDKVRILETDPEEE